LTWFRCGDRVLPLKGIRQIDVSRLVHHEVTIHHKEGTFVATGADAIDLIFMVKPSVLEGRRLRWVRHAWTVHNLVGHPLMQVLAWMGHPKWGVKIHDLTTPRPQI
jgi:hypothetical protein